MAPIPNPVHPFIQDAHFPKPEISTLDPSWRGTVIIPFSPTDDPASPVLKRYGPILTTNYLHPCIRRVKDKWYLFCINDTQTEIGIRTSDDGVNWTPYITLFTLADVGVNKNLFCPGVLYDIHLGRWWLYMDTKDTIKGRVNYYSYCDADPTVKANWSTPVSVTLPNRFTASIDVPRLLKLGRLYYISYVCDAYDGVSDRNIVWSYSTDCVNWTFGGLLLEKGAAGEWDDRTMHSFGLVYIYGIFYLVYCALEEAARIYRIGLAYRAADMFGIATKLFTNPIIAYDPDHVAFPNLIGMEEDFRIYYWAWGAITSGLYYSQIT